MISRCCHLISAAGSRTYYVKLVFLLPFVAVVVLFVCLHRILSRSFHPCNLRANLSSPSHSWSHLSLLPIQITIYVVLIISMIIIIIIVISHSLQWYYSYNGLLSSLRCSSTPMTVAKLGARYCIK